MEEVAWDRAVEQARAGEAACDVEALTLDGIVKCAQGRLPNSKVFTLFSRLKRLSIANVRLSTLADFPSLPSLEQLILSDNRIGGGLEHLVSAGLKSLRELDLSNNKIQAVEDLKPLAQLKLESLDLYECPVTRSTDYRSKVFTLIKSLRFLDKTDVTGNERLESDEEEEDVVDLNGGGVEVEGDEEGLEGDSKGGAVLEEEDEGGEEEERDDEDDYSEGLEDEVDDESGSFQEVLLAAALKLEVVQRHVNNEQCSEVDLEDDEDDNVEVRDIDESEDDDIADDDNDNIVVDEEDDDDELVSGAHLRIEGELDVQENEEEEDEKEELGEGEMNDKGKDDAFDNGEGREKVEEPVDQPEDEGASDFEPGDGEENEKCEGGENEEPRKESVGSTYNRKRSREETGEKESRLAKH